MNELSLDERDLLLRVVEKPELEGYFFKKIKTLKWFDPILEQGFLAPEKIPRPVEKEPGLFNVPQWPVLSYLTESSKKLAEYDNGAFAEKYLQLVREYTAYCQQHDISNYHVWWSLSEVLQNIPVELVTLDDVNMFSFWLDDKFDGGMTPDELVKVLLNWLGNFDEQHADKCLKLIEILFAIQKVKNERGTNVKQEPVLKSKSYRLTENIKAITEKAGALLGERVVRYFIEQLTAVINIRGGDEYCYVWRPAIEDHEQNMSARDTEDHFILAVRESLLSFERSANGALSALLLKLAGGDKNILKRIALYITNVFFENYKDDVFNVFLNADSLQSNLKHEMWELVKSNYVKFSDDQKANFTALVDDLKRYKALDEPDLYHQAEWLLAIKEHDAEASKRYDEIVDEIGVEPEHPGFSSYMTSSWVARENESPIPLETLKTIDDMAELVALLNKQPITHRFREPGIEGLTGCVKSFVLTEEEEGKQFFTKLNELQELKVIFLYEIVDAYNLIWREPDKYGAFSWKEAWPYLINFFEILVNKERFWNLNESGDEFFIGRQPWLVSGICQLLESGCKNDEDTRIFNVDRSDQVKGIISIILEKQPSVEFDEKSDAVSRAINSPKGQALETLINLALFECRRFDKENDNHEDVWLKYVDLFDTEKPKDNNTEFYALIPLYLNNFYYLSEQWMDESFEFFFDHQDEVKWVCALQGYAHNKFMHPKLYNLLKQENVFENFLDKELQDRVHKRYIEFGMIPYLSDKENLGDRNSLVERILARNNHDELRQVIWFIRSVVKAEEEKKVKVLELLPRIIEGIDFSELEGKKLASNLLHWLVFIEELKEETIGWIVKIAPYAEADYNYNDLVEAFAKWSENYPAKVAEIWIELLKESPGYPYPEEAYKTVYKNLINADMERQAKDIASGYLKYNAHGPTQWFHEVKEEQRNV